MAEHSSVGVVTVGKKEEVKDAVTQHIHHFIIIYNTFIVTTSTASYPFLCRYLTVSLPYFHSDCTVHYNNNNNKKSSLEVM